MKIFPPLYRLVIVAVVAIIVFKFFLIPARVAGVSMEPTYRENQLTFINRVSYWVGEPGRGDVVGVTLAGPSIMYMKRVVALPGEEISIVAGEIYIDGQQLIEPYVKTEKFKWEVPPRELKGDEYYVIGDNRATDQERHTFGAVKRRHILGQALW